jgi:DNA-binding transcriptional regulator WhiA
MGMVVNLKKRTWIETSDLYGNEIVNKYTNNPTCSLAELSREYKIAPNTVRKILEFHNIHIRSMAEIKTITNYENRFCNRKYTVDYDYFKKWSSNMAYILGFIYADGCIEDNDSRLNIRLQYNDIELLEKIKKELRYTGAIIKYISKIGDKEYKSCKLQISSIDIVNDLKKLGVVSNKSLVLQFPDIPQEYVIDFIRGYFDGDGSIDRPEYPRIRICSGSKEFLYQLQKSLTDFGFTEKAIDKKKNRNVYNICYSYKETVRLYNLFYNNKNCIFLKRKKDKLDLLLKNKNDNFACLIVNL